MSPMSDDRKCIVCDRPATRITIIDGEDVPGCTEHSPPLDDPVYMVTAISDAPPPPPPTAGTTAAGAAVDLADQIAERGWAEIRYMPGDATCYNLFFIPPATIVEQYGTGGRIADTHRRDWMVILANDFGRAYLWDGSADMHHSYVGQKWAPGYEVATGPVLADLFNALAAELATR